MPQELIELRSGADSRENWREINKQMGWLREHQRQIASANQALAELRATKYQQVGGGEAKIERYLLSVIEWDYLVCHLMTADGAPSGPEVKIAKPFNLRKTGWHGATVTYLLESYPESPGTLTVTYNYIETTYRTAAIGSYIEHQCVRPFWVPGRSVILAMSVENGTGVPGVDMEVVGCNRAWTMVA